MASPVVHFEIVGKDGESLKDFYKNVFAWEIDSDNPQNYGLVKAPESGGIGGGVGAASDGSPGHATFYIEVEDTDASLKKIEELGGKTVVPTTTIPDMVTFALFTDPEGNLVGLVKGR
jgi:predicted enzyme related to lactoylglutathione lyase